MTLIKKIKRRLAQEVYINFAQYLPCSFNRGGKFGKWLRSYCCKQFLLEVGDNVNIERCAKLETPYIKLGDNSNIGINCRVHGTLTIGDNTMMGPDCIIYTTNHQFDRLDMPMCFQGFQDQKPVTIGADVWIGGRVIILPGVTIGKGVIIGAGSVVTKDIPDYAIAAGNPATIKKYRTDGKV